MNHVSKSLASLTIPAILLVVLAACGGGDDAPTPSPTQTPIPALTVHFIDVGQGDATLIVAQNGESMLIDGGLSRERIRDRLTALGVTDLDAVLATHPDADHIGGLIEVLEMFDVERFYWNGQTRETLTYLELMAAAEAEATLTVSRRGDTIPLGDLTVKVLHPSALSGDSNVDSIVVEVSCGTVEILLTGDAESPSEAEMLGASVLSDIDLYKVGHHGSKTSTSAEFLARIAPEFGVISAGQRNQYGHPDGEVVDRLTTAGVDLWMTDVSGGDDTITLKSDCQTLSLEQLQPQASEATPTPAPSARPVGSPTATRTPTPTPTPTATPTPVGPTVRTVAPGEVFVTEMMVNPSAVSDAAGEWFEVFNTRSDVGVDINGWTIKDLGSNRHTIEASGLLRVPPLGYMVLGRNTDPGSNGGAEIDYRYSTFSLSNSADEVVLLDTSGNVIDAVAYSSAIVYDGASTSLDPATLDSTSNDVEANWCAATSDLPGGDKGTPGRPNDPC
ncbi:MAG: MBL fold metallo-hydrolase [Chloroflexi bacterium]|nr:MBL fold metallo-hydrolase [Chloroflexota bacterium]